MALDVGPGNEVIVPDITFIGSASAVILVGARPVFVDVEPATFQIDLEAAERAITSRSKAIMPVHLYGTACDMAAVLAFAGRHGLRVIEDAAQGIGVHSRGRHVGSFGDVGCFSFFADKTITTGEGGFVVCQDSAIHDRLRHLRNQGRLSAGSFVHPAIGYNFRITDVQAAIGLVQLDKLDEIIRRKRAIYGWYKAALGGIAEVRILGGAPAATHVPFRCVLIADRAEALQRHLTVTGVQTRGLFVPMHRQPCFVEALANLADAPSFDDREFPNAVYGVEHGLCLPIFPTLPKEDVQFIADSIGAFYA